MNGTASPDAVIAALDDLVAALRENIAANEAAIERLESIRTKRGAGMTYGDIAHSISRPMAVEMITGNIDRLAERGAAFRRSQAKALHDEGLTMQEIAELFGVSRQRISAILRSGAQ